MPKCTADELDFGRLGRRVIETNFAGGALSADGGLNDHARLPSVR